MRKRALTIILLLTVLLSGCITVRFETKIKKDGSGTKSFVLALDKSVVSMMESMAQEAGASTQDFWDEVRAGADSIEGAKVEDYSDSEAQGIKVTVPFDSIEELQALSNSEAFEGADVINVSRNGNITTLRITVNVGELASGLDEAGGQGLEDLELGEIELDYTYAVEVEGKILEYSPKDIAEIESSQVIWDLTRSHTDSIELMLKWEPSGGVDMGVILLIAVALGGLALFIGGVILTVRSRQTSNQMETG